jgi:hypothetical protein
VSRLGYGLGKRKSCDEMINAESSQYWTSPQLKYIVFDAPGKKGSYEERHNYLNSIISR